jgi:cell division protein FtsN
MGAKSDVAVKLVLVFFISLLSFSIGTYIGKKYSDNQHKLAQLEPSSGTDEKRAIASEGHGDHHAAPAKDQMISDDEIKNLADEKLKKEEFIADDTAHADPHATKETREPAKSHADPHAAPAKDHAAPAHADTHHSEAKKEDHNAAPAHKPTTKHTEDAPLEAAKTFLNGKVPEAKVAPKVENRLPTSLPKDISQYALGKFTVQVASYATKEEAEKRATKLKEQGYQTNVIPAKVNDKQWYRVSFGLYGTQEEAQTERSKYLEKNKTDSALVQKIKN